MNEQMTTTVLPTPASAAKAVDPLFAPSDTFVHRHIGPNEAEQKEMLVLLGYRSLEELMMRRCRLRFGLSGN